MFLPKKNMRNKSYKKIYYLDGPNNHTVSDTSNSHVSKDDSVQLA